VNRQEIVEFLKTEPPAISNQTFEAGFGALFFGLFASLGTTVPTTFFVYSYSDKTAQIFSGRLLSRKDRGCLGEVDLYSGGLAMMVSEKIIIRPTKPTRRRIWKRFVVSRSIFSKRIPE